MIIEKGMYGLKKASIITTQEFVNNMAPFVYHPVQHTPVIGSMTVEKKT